MLIVVFSFLAHCFIFSATLATPDLSLLTCKKGIDQIGIDQIGVDQMGVEQMGVEQMGVDQIGVDQIGVDQMGRHL